MTTPFVLEGQKIIKQIAEAPTAEEKRVLIAELQRHLAGGVKPMPRDYKVAQSGEEGS